ncbi:MAG: DUF6183 family protein [Acidimicrobiales bacterium]
MTTSINEAIAIGDIDELLRWVDRLCDAKDWELLTQLATRCQGAFAHTGHQLWPAANHASYRLALQAPGQWAASAIHDGGGRFALGPLTEVAASTHTWEEIAPYLQPGPTASLFAHECVIRGEVLTDNPLAAELATLNVVDLPLELKPWEPEYCVATYHPDRIESAGPAQPTMPTTTLPSAGQGVEDNDSEAALRSLVEPWIVESNGSAKFVGVKGSAESAVASLAGDLTIGLAEVTTVEALRHLAWAGASGGAHGRRRGAGLGRFGAWWVLRALGGLPDDEPLDPDELGEAAVELRWMLWTPSGPQTGWNLHLAAEDPEEGLAWAFTATDHM